MSLLIELVINGATTLGVMGGASWLFHRRQKKSGPNDLGAYAWRDILNNANTEFHCPKCTHRNDEQPKICNCEEYYREHFHYRCDGAKKTHCCGYTCILRVQDDRD